MMPPGWKSFWEGYSRREVETEADLFAQVARTVEAVPITSAHFKLLVQRIAERLELDPADTLFDYCCGNGLVTYELAPRVQRIIAIDFVEQMVESARSRRQRANVEYHVGDALEPISRFVGRNPPNKFLMGSSLAYFGPADLGTILGHLLDVSPGGSFLFFITEIPDVDRKWNFFDTPERRAAHREHEKLGDTASGVGRWWSKEELAQVARAYGLAAEVEPEPPGMTDYRMDALIR
jgi:predicted TPR repeat methyltransferase